MIKALEIPCLGYSIAADWYSGASDMQILLVLPGYTSSKARHVEFVSALVTQTGMSALVIDYSGHGESPFELGDTRPAQHFLEVMSAFDWLQEHHPDSQISVTGASYGGFFAAGLTKYRSFKKLVVRAPAIYQPENFYTPWSVRLSDKAAYLAQIRPYRNDSAQLLEHPFLSSKSIFQGKTLVVIHENDEVVPRPTTDAYISAFNADTYTARGFGHALSRSPVSQQQLDEYYGYIANWLKT